MTDIKHRIFQAQSYRGIEPVEYMVPYPNLGALPESQTIKFPHRILMGPSGYTAQEYFNCVKQTALWLQDQGIQPGDTVLIEAKEIINADILAFGIWLLGAVLVLHSGDENSRNQAIRYSKKFIDGLNKKKWSHINQHSHDFIPRHKSLLNDLAVVYFTGNRGIKLSHYNILLNAYGTQRLLNLQHSQSFWIDIPPDTTAWIVLQVVLPFVAGARLDDSEPDLRIGFESQIDNPDYLIKLHWNQLKITTPETIYILPENTAVVAKNDVLTHMTDVQMALRKLTITGHSVMMGYLEASENEKVFSNQGLMVNFPV